MVQKHRLLFSLALFSQHRDENSSWCQTEQGQSGLSFNLLVRLQKARSFTGFCTYGSLVRGEKRARSWQQQSEGLLLKWACICDGVLAAATLVTSSSCLWLPRMTIKQGGYLGLNFSSTRDKVLHIGLECETPQLSVYHCTLTRAIV